MVEFMSGTSPTSHVIPRETTLFTCLGQESTRSSPSERSPTRVSRSLHALHSTFGSLKDYMTPRSVSRSKKSAHVHSDEAIRAFFATLAGDSMNSLPVDTLSSTLRSRGMGEDSVSAFLSACERHSDDEITADELLIGMRGPGMAELFSNVSILQPGWVEVRDGADVYYWNPATDQTSWMEPLASADAYIEDAKSMVARFPSYQDAVAFSTSHADLSPFLSDSLTGSTSGGGGDGGATPPGQVEDLEAGVGSAAEGIAAEGGYTALPIQSMEESADEDGVGSAHANEGSPRAAANRVISWPPAPETPELGLRGASWAITRANAVLARVGMPTVPPPPPVSVAARMRMYQRAHNPEFDDSMWQWRQGRWVHLPPPPRVKREVFALRSKRTPFTVSRNTFGGLTGFPESQPIPRPRTPEPPPPPPPPPPPKPLLTSEQARTLKTALVYLGHALALAILGALYGPAVWRFLSEWCEPRAALACTMHPPCRLRPPRRLARSACLWSYGAHVCGARSPLRAHPLA